MPQIIVGTAGHVDHGKTQLVKALTGIDTDRLKEEQKRGISIELGFAPLVLDDGTTLGIVDVPGHEKFIKQMLSGVAGIDLVLLVIAADEGIMPQTQEHLDIIDLLEVKKGIIVISKKDLVDEEWLEIIQLEISDAVKGTVLENAPQVAVSAITGEGLGELKRLLGELTQETPVKPGGGKARLPIDRVFSVTGFGTVVTGTLWSGTLHLGDNVEVLPQALKSKIRSLQVHGKKVEEALAGQRVAANLTGLEVDDIPRGSVLAQPDYLKYTYRFDARIRVLPKAHHILKNLDRVRVYLGTKEALGKIRLMDRDELDYGQEAFAQIYLEEPLVAARGDRFVIRTYSPMYTIAGGTIIDPLAVKHQRFAPGITQALEKIAQGNPKELIMEYLLARRKDVTYLKNIVLDLQMEEAIVEKVIRELEQEKQVLVLGKGLIDGFFAAYLGEEWFKKGAELLQRYHHEHPLRQGMDKEEFRSRGFASLGSKEYQLLLEEWVKKGRLQLQGQFVSVADWRPQPSVTQQELLRNILKELAMRGLQPDSPQVMGDKLRVAVDQQEELWQYLVSSGEIVKVEETIYLSKDVLEEAVTKILVYARAHQGITLAEARDVLASTRKYVLPILEYMDGKRMTKRIGEKRVAINTPQG